MAKKSEEIKSTKPAKAKPKTTTKKVVKKVIEEVQEDKNIKKVANSCCNCQSFSCCALIVLFAFVLSYIFEYGYKLQNNLKVERITDDNNQK